MPTPAAATPPTAAPSGLAVKRPRGRPRGAKTRVLQPAVALGVHHFAFLRSGFQGLDVQQAWQRYLAFSEPGGGARRIERRRRALLQAVLHAGRALQSGRSDAAQIGAALSLVAEVPQATHAQALPTLDEFITAQGLDREFYTEAELLQEYRDFHHLDTVAEAGPPGPEARPPVLAQVHALNLLEALLARTPGASDPLALWLSPSLTRQLHSVGVGTLSALADMIRVHGPRWWRRARGLGQARAASLLQWLAPLAAGFGRALPDDALAPPPPNRRPDAAMRQRLALGPRFALVPLETLAVPVPLARAAAAVARAGRPVGGPGAASGAQAAPAGAQVDDLTALRAWLASHQAQRATHRAYTKEVERFYLWCLHVRQLPLGAATAADCQAYRAFLAALPPDWVNPRPTPRADPAWRPFRGPLSEASQRYAWGVVQAMFDGLVSAGHLHANPVRALPHRLGPAPPPASAAGSGSTPRAFSQGEWHFIEGRLADELSRAGAAAAVRLRRLQLVLALLRSTGLRLAELALLTRADLHQRAGAADAHDGWTLRVRGPAPRRRMLALPAAVMALLQRHHADVGGPALPSPSPAHAPVPLVCALGQPPLQRLDAAGSSPRRGVRALADVPTMPALSDAADGTAAAALGERGMALMLKRFFRRIARHASAVDGLSAQRLHGASAHWLRHSFGHQGAAAGMPLPELQRALGHASPAGASAYLAASSGGRDAPPPWGEGAG